MTPKRFPGTVPLEAVRAEAEKLEPGAEADTTVRVAGRVLGRREMGKLVFLDLIDRSGRIQLLCDTSRSGVIDVALGDVVGVTGAPAKARRGEPSIAVEELVLLGKNRSPLPDTFHGLTDTEQRYRKRYLDLLMNEDARRAAPFPPTRRAPARALALPHDRGDPCLPRLRWLRRGRYSDPATAIRRRVRGAVRHALE